MFNKYLIRAASSYNRVSVKSTFARATFATAVDAQPKSTSEPTQTPQQPQQTTESSSTEAVAFPSAVEPPKYVLTTLRSFPSLEPHSLIPVHAKLLNEPIRRDILWASVIMELDNKRVGASNPPGRSDHKFSRKKLFKQKGTGRARVGDANSPIRWRGAYALAANAPNDFSTELPKKMYYLGYRVALSDYYRQGKLFIIGQDAEFESEVAKASPFTEKLKEGDNYSLEICTSETNAMTKFVKSHGFEKLNLLFVVDDYEKVANLREAIKNYPSEKIAIMRKEDVEVRNLLKAHRIIMDKDALTYFGGKYTAGITF
ncbi:unnamed protein product [Ambrosiozyma monospora]|uniref:Large ribosomal subunit protein uL4m n=1 Tax=Ambrosiozyma monospora TaxID=43982 RepID=A0A9W6YQ61_AMBMO|nr:unnamed protein product [Ambrosiozyma monospora]